MLAAEAMLKTIFDPSVASFTFTTTENLEIVKFSFILIRTYCVDRTNCHREPLGPLSWS
jgi:hypothetical protein